MLSRTTGIDLPLKKYILDRWLKIHINLLLTYSMTFNSVNMKTAIFRLTGWQKGKEQTVDYIP